MMISALFIVALSGALAQGPPKTPKITVEDQKGEKGSSLKFTFTIEKADRDLDKDQVHISKASKDHKFTNARFTVELSGDSDKLTGTASADNLSCDDQSGYIIYYQRIPPPPKEGPPPGSFMLQIDGCPTPERAGPPQPDPKITVDAEQKAKKGDTLKFTFSLESRDKSLTKDKVYMVKVGEDRKMTPVRFTLSYEVSDKKISGTAEAKDVTCDDQSGYLVYYDQVPPPPPHHGRFSRHRNPQPGPPPGGFRITVDGCSK